MLSSSLSWLVAMVSSSLSRPVAMVSTSLSWLCVVAMVSTSLSWLCVVAMVSSSLSWLVVMVSSSLLQILSVIVVSSPISLSSLLSSSRELLYPDLGFATKNDTFFSALIYFPFLFLFLNFTSESESSLHFNFSSWSLTLSLWFLVSAVTNTHSFFGWIVRDWNKFWPALPAMFWFMISLFILFFGKFPVFSECFGQKWLLSLFCSPMAPVVSLVCCSCIIFRWCSTSTTELLMGLSCTNGLP